jgi:hypothetical protein
MTDQTPVRVQQEKPTGLALLRAPFAPNQISKLPKPTKAQTDAVRADFKKGIRCAECGQWHHPSVVHLDYVGHAALTDRLLEADPAWNWEPCGTDDHGMPRFDPLGGMWIRLTVCGVTRLGYGHAEGKRGGDAIKEVIGDALRNAAMRFGAALDLWHKGDLHAGEDDDAPLAVDAPADDRPESPPVEAIRAAVSAMSNAATLDALKAVFTDLPATIKRLPAVIEAKDARKAALEADPIAADEIPY